MDEKFTHMEWLRRIGEDNCCIVPNSTIRLVADLRREAGELVVAQYAITAAEARIAVLEAALTRSRIALDDWLNTYAADLCAPDRVKEAWDRIGLEGGTLAYIAFVQEQNRDALGPQLAGRQALSEAQQ